MFICLPGINGAKWPEDVTKVFSQNYQGRGDEPWRDYAFLRIQGCTFSGDPYTTVRNTMASDCYGIYYRFKNGEHTPWESHNTAQIEAGDDLVIWGDDSLNATILSLTSRTKSG